MTPTLSTCAHWLMSQTHTRLQVLPEIGERWSYNGSTVVANGRHAGRAADVWVWRVDDDQGYGTYHNMYTFLAGRVRVAGDYEGRNPVIRGHGTHCDRISGWAGCVHCVWGEKWRVWRHAGYPRVLCDARVGSRWRC